MRAREFLLEYNRQVTANQVGDRIISAFSKDTSAEIARLVPNLGELSNSLRTLSRASPEQIAASISPERRRAMIDLILSAIEQKDPTPNKAYTPWIAKMYAKAGGGLRIEDINRMDLLNLYDIAKKRRKVKPEHADINRFKWYSDFEDEMENSYNFFQDLDADTMPAGQATKVFDDENALIVVPHDEAAACKYGRGTRWCTAATRGENYFNQYNRMGKLYIIIPKKPQHEGEKYQIHFESNSFMNEDDHPVSVGWLLMKRFPDEKMRNFFMELDPSLKERIEFTSDEELQEALDSVNQIIQDAIWERVSDWEMNDDYYYKTLRDEGFVDEDGDIDWDKVDKAGMSYSEYNPEVEEFARSITRETDITPAELREFVEEEMEDYGGAYDGDFPKVRSLPDILAVKLRNKFSNYSRRETDGGIGEFLERKVSMKKQNGKWEAYIIQPLSLNAR